MAVVGDDRDGEEAARDRDERWNVRRKKTLIHYERVGKPNAGNCDPVPGTVWYCHWKRGSARDRTAGEGCEAQGLGVCLDDIRASS